MLVLYGLIMICGGIALILGNKRIGRFCENNFTTGAFLDAFYFPRLGAVGFGLFCLIAGGLAIWDFVMGLR